jgi:hypothetical protein
MYSLYLQVLELIRKKNNLKNTLTKRRKNGDDSYNMVKVRPLHKSGNRRHYRPISVLSPVNKIFEKVIYHRLLTFINKHYLIFNLDSGRGLVRLHRR